MVTRCVAEGVKRGVWSEEDAGQRSAYLEIAEHMEDNEDEDLLIGALTVGKAEQKKLEWVAQAAVRRVVVLGALIDYLNGAATAKLVIPGIETGDASVSEAASVYETGGAADGRYR